MGVLRILQFMRDLKCFLIHHFLRSKSSLAAYRIGKGVRGISDKGGFR